MTCSEEYIEKCSKILYGAPSVTRNKIVWTEEQKQRVTEQMKKYPFLKDFSFDWKGANKFAWYFSYPIQITPCNLMVILHLGKKLNALLFSFVFTFLCGPSRSVGHMFDRTIHVFEYQVQGS